MLTQIHIWCKFGQNKISDLNARVDYNNETYIQKSSKNNAEVMSN